MYKLKFWMPFPSSCLCILFVLLQILGLLSISSMGNVIKIIITHSDIIEASADHPNGSFVFDAESAKWNAHSISNGHEDV